MWTGRSASKGLNSISAAPAAAPGVRHRVRVYSRRNNGFSHCDQVTQWLKLMLRSALRLSLNIPRSPCSFISHKSTFALKRTQGCEMVKTEIVSEHIIAELDTHRAAYSGAAHTPPLFVAIQGPQGSGTSYFFHICGVVV